MISGTTPTIRLNIAALDLTQCHGLRVTIRQRNTVIDFKDLAVSEHKIECYLTQEQSLLLAPGSCKMQVNGLTQGGTRWATVPKVIDITEQLLREVIS